LSEHASNVELNQHTLGEIETYACGYTTTDGFMEHPCPCDPKFPKLSEYTLTLSLQGYQWVCSAVGMPAMAQRVSLPTAVRQTEEIARRRMSEQYSRMSRPWRCRASESFDCTRRASLSHNHLMGPSNPPNLSRSGHNPNNRNSAHQDLALHGR